MTVYLCRKCQAPAVDVRRDHRNERLFSTYVHVDGTEHTVSCLSLDAQETVDEDERIHREAQA